MGQSDEIRNDDAALANPDGIDNLLRSTFAWGSSYDIQCDSNEFSFMSYENFDMSKFPELFESFNKNYKKAYQTGKYDTVQPKESKEFLGYFLLSKPKDLTITVYESGLLGGQDMKKIKVKFPGKKSVVEF